MNSQDKNPPTSPPQPELSPTLTKDELNLAEFPFSLPAHRHPKGKNVIRVTIPGTDPEGRPIVREWVARGSGDLGLPLATDEEVLLGLFHVWQKEGFKERHVWFTQHRLFKLLRWSPDAKSYHRLHEAMIRLKGLSIESNQTFWDNNKQCHVTDGFGIVDSYRLWRRDAHDGDDTPFLSRISFTEAIYSSIQAGYIKTLDLDFYLSLHYPLSRKLYRFLDKRTYRRPDVEMRLCDLADRLAMADSAYPSVIKKRMKDAHQELIDLGFLESVSYEERHATPWVRYSIVPKQRRQVTFASEKRESPQYLPNPLARELVTRGVTDQVAAALVESFGEVRVAEQIEAFDFLRKQNSRQLSKNPPGYLRSAIEGGFAMPAGYVPKADRERKRQEHEAAERRQVEAKAAKERAEQEDLDRFENFYVSLPDADRGAIMDAAMARLNEFERPLVNKDRTEGLEGPGHFILRCHRNALLAQRILEGDHAAQLQANPGRMGTEVPLKRRSTR